MSSARIAVFAVAVSVLAGCAGMSEQACLTSDWRTVGFEDGSVGRAESMIGTYRQQCAEHGVSPDLDAYRAGHAQGVQSYCKAGNGFEVGHSGATYQGVCPQDLEAGFVREYNSGRRLYDLEAALRDVDNRISSGKYEQEQIRGELTRIAATIAATDTTVEQRVLLVSRSAELGRRYGELSTMIEVAQRDRVGHEVELREYQQTLALR
ncbi:MAG TPA: DUF2799 domain-containing protein [Gammaproteobacteria bacterium]|nr:DUF2799 domain-containing protein [Gammaproteobacteria bacterium]